MVKLIKYLLLLCCFLPFGAEAQDLKYIALFPDSLKQNANAIIREYSASFVQNDINSGVYKERKVITILNKKGDDAFAHFLCHDDKFRSLSSFSAIVRNALGKEIKKAKKGDLVVSSIVNGAETLASDNIVLAYNFQSPSYPYTIEYSYEQKWSKGMLSYPVFAPIDGYTVSVESADYTIETPANVELRSKANFDLDIKKTNVNGKNVYSMSVKNLKAIEYEPYAPDSREILPFVFFAPAEFCYDSYCGNMADWKSYGLWVNRLLKDRDVIPTSLEAKLKEMTQNVGSEREKVKLIYEYLQNNTRYLNIALGIGGFQPFEADKVAKTGFGDCKALTNYMRVMLKSIGIHSNYSLISTEYKDMYADYPNFNQLNHVVLLVPLKNDSIWLECTSQVSPFGYIHESIAGHDALVISEEGGKICRLPLYPDSENKTVTKIVYELDEVGKVKGNIHLSEFLSNSESTNYFFKKNDREELVKYVNRNVSFPHIDYGDFKTDINSSDRPSTTLAVGFSSNEFSNKTGNRLFVPVCPLKNGNFDLFKTAKRNLDIDIASGYSELDTIEIVIPASYISESLPKDIDLKTPFGNYITRAEQKDGKIIYTQNIDLFTGRYNKSQYDDLKAFLDQIVSGTKRRLVLKKAE